MKTALLALILCAACGDDTNSTTPDACAACLDGTSTMPDSCSSCPDAGVVELDGRTDDSLPPQPQIPGGTFFRSYDSVTSQGMNMGYPATISGFTLDKYEVTVARFRVFVAATALPTAPLACATSPTFPAMWTDTPGANEQKPIDCITWTEADAFCRWDGGRLPTEAEWNYAAAGGSEQRVYPWSVPATDQTLDANHASYNTLQNVGSKPAGDARWGQSDMAGNVAEWTQDWYADPYTNPCVDCTNTTPSTARVHRGGSVTNLSPETWISVVRRAAAPPTNRSSTIGVRCAR